MSTRANAPDEDTLEESFLSTSASGANQMLFHPLIYIFCERGGNIVIVFANTFYSLSTLAQFFDKTADACCY